MGTKDMDMSAMVSGQDAINAKRKEIDSFFRMIDAFLKQCDREDDFWTSPPMGVRAIVISHDDLDEAYTFEITSERKIALWRGNGLGGREGNPLTGQSLRLREVAPLHKILGDKTEALLEFNGLLEECLAYIAPFQGGKKVVIVTPGKSKYTATFHHHPGLTGSGRTVSEAIGSLVMFCSNEFNIDIVGAE